MVSQAEMLHLNKMAELIRSEGGLSKTELILRSEVSIAWAEKLIKYIPILFKDIRYDKKHGNFVLLSTLSTLSKEIEK